MWGSGVCVSMFFFDGGECACVSTAGMVCVVVHARGDDDVRSGDGDLRSGACSW